MTLFLDRYASIYKYLILSEEVDILVLKMRKNAIKVGIKSR
jgi:sRNA-binding carbon storage regulator CsrA